MAEELTEIRERLTRTEESTKSAHHRLDAVENTQKEIHDLAISVNSLALSVQAMSKSNDDLKKRLGAIEERPGKRLDQIVSVIIAALASGVVGYLIGAIFK